MNIKRMRQSICQFINRCESSLVIIEIVASEGAKQCHGGLGGQSLAIRVRQIFLKQQV